MSKIDIHSIVDSDTNTVTYIVSDPATKAAAVIDPVLDSEPDGRHRTTSADAIIRYLDDNRLSLEWILETCIHVDHLTASQYLKQKRGGHVATGEGFKAIQRSMSELLNFQVGHEQSDEAFDYLFADGEVFHLGHILVEVMLTPGHTPCCVSYRIEDAVFVGDTLVLPELGAPRTDLPNSCAKTLYHSSQRVFSLPEHTRVFLGHQSTSQNIQQQFETSILQERRGNQALSSDTNELDFIESCLARDEQLSKPKLNLNAIKWNMQAGISDQ